MIDRILEERYELLELIGSGGMADVYRARDQLLDRPVAVKILHAQFKNDTEFIGKFHREAQAAARLSHPHIVNIYDVGVSGEDHYIVMEYVQGSTLKSRIKEEGSLPIAAALHIAKEIADALHHAHTNNLGHCDIKPHNILLTADGHAKVADFGIARAVTESTMTYSGNVVGSVHYFSPEQAKGTIITPKSDVYSLGIVLYEMLTGKLPFTGETPVSIAMKHLQEEPAAPRQYRQDIPPVVEAIVLKAMSKDPNLRPDSHELMIELGQAEHMLATDTVPSPDPYATQVLPRVQGTIAAREAQWEPEETEPEDAKPFLRSKLFIAGLLLVLMMGFGVGAFLSFGRFWSTEEVAVPDVTGKQMTLARQILEDSKLRVNVAETYDATVSPGQVVSQSPEAGSTVKADRLVTIYVSKGGEALEMPDLKGLSKASALDRLQKMGLKVDSVYEKYSDDEPGTVIGQDPAIGSKISKGQKVDITVSKGKQTKHAKVPDVTGASLDAARSSLESRKLKVGSITKQKSSQAAGTVISQSPSPTSELEEGSTVDLVIAETETAPAAEPSASKTERKEAPKENVSADEQKAPDRGGNDAGKSR